MATKPSQERMLALTEPGTYRLQVLINADLKSALDEWRDQAAGAVLVDQLKYHSQTKSQPASEDVFGLLQEGARRQCTISFLIRVILAGAVEDRRKALQDTEESSASN